MNPQKIFQNLNQRIISKFRFLGAQHQQIIFLILIFGIYVLHAMYFGKWINDDAGISFVFAKNFADGYGFVLNPGWERVEGYTNFLWVVLLSGFFKLGLFDPVITPKVLGGLFGIGTIYFVYKISLILLPDEYKGLSFLAPLILAFSTPFVVWSISGLANSFFSFLLILSTYWILLEIIYHKQKFCYLSSVSLLLLSLTRPEGVMYFVAIFVYRIFFLRNQRLNVIWLLIFIIPYSAYHIWHYFYFSYIFYPNTYFAKASHRTITDIPQIITNFSDPGWKYVFGFFNEYNFAFVFIFLFALVKRVRKNSLLLLIGACAIFYPIYVGGDWFRQYRFLSPFIPIGLLMISVGLGSLLFYLDKFIKIKAYVPKIFLILIVFTLLAYPCLDNSSQFKEDPTVPFQNVANKGFFAKTQAEKASIKNEASFAVPDLGATAYYSDLHIVDYAGLADVAIAHNGFNPIFFRDYMFHEVKPTFLQFHGTFSRRTAIYSYPELIKDYTDIKSNYHGHGPHQGLLAGVFVRKDTFIIKNDSIQNQENFNYVNEELTKNISLLGYSVDTKLVPANSTIHLTLVYKCVNTTKNDYSANITLVSKNEEIKDTQFSPVYDWYHTSEWRIGELIKEQRRIKTVEVEKGTYKLYLSLEKEDGANSSKPKDKVFLTEIEVDPQKAKKLGQKMYEEAVSLDNGGNANEAYRKMITSKRLTRFNESMNNSYDMIRQHYAEFCYEKGLEETKSDDLDKARTYFIKARNIMPVVSNTSLANKLTNHSNYFYNEAKTELDNENYIKGFKFLRKALLTNPKNSFIKHRMEEVRSKMLLDKYVIIENESDIKNIEKLNLSFSNKINLIGYRIEKVDKIKREAFKIVYYWKCQQNMSKDYRILTQFRDKDGKYLFGRGSSPVYGMHPTSKWTVGQIIKEYYIIVVPKDVEENSFNITLRIRHAPTSEWLEPIPKQYQQTQSIARIGEFKLNST